MEEQEQRILERLRRDPHRAGCSDFLAGLMPLHRHEILNDLAFDRLRYKMELVRTLHEAGGRDWNQTFYRLYFRTLADRSNQAAYLTLAERAPYRILQIERDHALAIESILLGVSGLLMLYEHDDYVIRLLQEFKHYAAKYDLEPMDPARWQLASSRPANHPMLRLAQAASFFAKDANLFDRLRNCSTPREVQELFGVEASPYWSAHYTPDAERELRPKRIGKSKSEMLGINLVAVLQFAYGSSTGNEELVDRAFRLLTAIEPEDNRIIRAWREAGVPAPANAFESQALLQLRFAFCDPGRCAACPVGRRIVDRVAHETAGR